ncbi:hypothetical protein niasHS_003994 [Heterodera schachtii]|uniref:Rho-GAP domain-containing protein n=1 Tax=Heterodera schachtii TaxID=97005 RepID=A0ABD2K3S0_HETSC
MLLGSDLAAALGTSASRATTPTRAQTPLVGGDRPSPATARRRLLHPSVSRQRSPLPFAPNILRPNQCQHFHYDSVELGPVKVKFMGMEEEEKLEEKNGRETAEEEKVEEEEEEERGKRKPKRERKRQNKNGSEVKFTLSIESNGKVWDIVRTSAELVEFDRQLHRCVFDRRHSRLKELDTKNSRLKGTICCYADRLSLLTGSLMRCYAVLTFFELDNRGNHFLPVERSLPNVPAVACAVAICPFVASQSDHLRLRVGDIVSVVEIIETECDEKWMRGKLTVPSNDSEERLNDNSRRFGIFPAHCVRLFSDRLSLGEQLWMASNSAASTTAHSLVRRSLASFSPCQRPNGATGSPSLFSYALIRSFIVRLSKHASSSSSSHPTPLFRRSESPQISSSSVFGVDLENLMAKSQNRHKEKTKVADVVEQCIRVVESRGMEAGIYRQCGVQSNVRRLRRMFSSGTLSDLGESPSISELLTCDIHSVGSLLKHFFRQLPNPLIPFHCHQKLIDLFGTANGSFTTINGRELISKVSQIVKEFPAAYYHNAKRLFLHLQFVARHPRTQTNARNLAIIWTPNLIRLNMHTDICTVLIAFADKIFADSSGGGSIGIVSRSSSMGSIEVEKRKQRNDQLSTKYTGGKSSPKTAPMKNEERNETKGKLTELNGGGGGGGVQQQQIGAVHSVIERPKGTNGGKRRKRQKKSEKMEQERRTKTKTTNRGTLNQSVDQCVRSPPLGQRLFSPLGKSLDGMGHSMFRRVRSMRHSVRRKFFKESPPKLSKSCHQLGHPLAFPPSAAAFVAAEKCPAAATEQKETARNGGNSTGPCSPSSALLAIPFADDACSSSRISSSTSPALSRSFASCDALSATTTKWAKTEQENKGEEERMAREETAKGAAEKRVNFGDGRSDGEQQKETEQYKGRGRGDTSSRRDSVESIPLDISRYDNVHSIITTNTAR